MKILFLLLVLASCASHQKDCSEKDQESCVKEMRPHLFMERSPR